MKNVGSIDKVLRIVIGVGLISLVFTGPETVWGWFGIIPLLTAFMSFCPLYSLLKINTGSSKNKAG